jgi:hypothetical protein
VTEDEEFEPPLTPNDSYEPSQVSAEITSGSFYEHEFETPFASPSPSFPNTLSTGNITSITAQEFEDMFSTALTSASVQHMGTSKPFSDDFVVRIAELLAAVGKQRWSERPRTYLVLRLIDEVKVMDDLILNGFKDIDFPYTELTIPECIKENGVQRNFLQKQRYVLSERSADLVRGGRHRHLGKHVP